VGGLLGTGGFCEVRCCLAKAKKGEMMKNKKKMWSRGDEDDNNMMMQQQHAPEEAAHQDASQLLYDSSTAPPNDTTASPDDGDDTNQMAKYAIKYLSPSRTAPHHSDPKNKVFQRGIADLAVEACFLSLLRHENIITCYYVSQGSLEENFNAQESNNAAAGKKGAAASNGGKNSNSSTSKKKKKKYKEEIVVDDNGDLILRHVLIPSEDDDDQENALQNQQQMQLNHQVDDADEEEVYRHRFGYFLLLDVLHETLAHRIDHVYIPQVLLTSSNNNNGSSFHASSDLTASLLHMQEKRDSFLKRMTSAGKRRPSSLLFHNKQSSSSGGSAALSSSPNTCAPGIRSITHPHGSNNKSIIGQSQRSHVDIIYNQKQKLAQRLTSLLAIANALQYLHEHQILFRDIKPDNIGFYRDYSAPCTCGAAQSSSSSSTGDGQDADAAATTTRRDCTCFVEIPKLFDFGLAKELKSKYRVEDGHRRLWGNCRDYSEIKEYAHHEKGGLLRKSFSSNKSNRLNDEELNAVYKLTGCTGSRRYMAPEVCFHDPYNEKADVYSFGMMLYQVASLVTPFDGYSSYDHEKEVLRGGFRPDIDLPTKKDLITCKRIEGEIFEALENGQDVGDDVHPDLPAPTEKRNEVLAIKSKSLWTKDLKRLVDDCWDYDMRYRPPMKEVVVRLQGCIDELMVHPKGRDSLEGRADVSRGSLAVLHRKGGNGGKENEDATIREDSGEESVAEIRSNVSDTVSSRESVKKKSFFRPSRNQGKGSVAVVAVTEIQQ